MTAETPKFPYCVHCNTDCKFFDLIGNTLYYICPNCSLIGQITIPEDAPTEDEEESEFYTDKSREYCPHGYILDECNICLFGNHNNDH